MATRALPQHALLATSLAGLALMASGCGRALLYGDLLKALANAGLKTTAASLDAIPGGGSLKQADGSSVSYDGKGGVVWISR